jgi:hypothetical protein
LFDVNSLFQKGIALRVFPDFDALLLYSKEWQSAVQKNLGRVARLASTSLGIKHVALRPWKEVNG